MHADQPYRVAIIGRTGKGNYGHGLDTVWVNHPRATIVAVADENEAGRVAAQKRLATPKAYADYREMLMKERPQIVSVADRWLDAHRDMVIACAQSGAHIFLEKPMCRTLAEADEMIAACEKHHVKLAIAHQTRYSPRIARIKEIIAEGRIGDIVELRGRGKEDTRGGGQDLMVLGTHIMDLMRAIVGDAKWCFARCWHEGRLAKIPGDVRMGGEGMGGILGDRISATYGFENGVVGHFGTHKAKAGSGTRFGLFIHGTKGVIHVGTGSLPVAYLLEDPAWLGAKTGQAWQPISSAGVGKAETLADGGLGLGNQWIVQDLLEAIEKDRQPLGNMYDGRAALEMILAVYESHRQERPVELPLKSRKHPLA